MIRSNNQAFPEINSNNQAFSEINSDFELFEFTDLRNEIFTHLEPKQLLKFAQVNTFYKDHTYKILKEIIYKDFFNPGDWNEYYPTFQSPISNGDLALKLLFDRELALKLLPENIYTFFKGFSCPLFKGKKLCETHHIVWIPGHMNINKYLAFFEHCPAIYGNHSQVFSKDGYEIEIWNKAFEELGSLETLEAEWVIIPKKIKADSKAKRLSKKFSELPENGLFNYEPPSPLEVLISIASTFFKSKTHVYSQLERAVHISKEIDHQIVVGYYKNLTIMKFRNANKVSTAYSALGKFL